MDILNFLHSLEVSALATRIRDSLWLFPLIESTHVIAITLVFGSVFIIDLRLLGLASAARPFKRLSSEILKWTWAAFALAVVTGSLMFITNARVYYHNGFFRAKMLLLVLAGLNMMVFELSAGRSVTRWDHEPSAPSSGKIAAALSIVLWIAVIFMGRLIGFTTTRAAVVAPPANVNFDDFLQRAPQRPPPPAPATPE